MHAVIFTLKYRNFQLPKSPITLSLTKFVAKKDWLHCVKCTHKPCFSNKNDSTLLIIVSNQRKKNTHIGIDVTNQNALVLEQVGEATRPTLWHLAAPFVCRPLWKHRNEVVFNSSQPSGSWFTATFREAGHLCKFRFSEEDRFAAHIRCNLVYFMNY